MSSFEGNNRQEEIDIKIQNKDKNSEIDLVSAEQRVVNITETSTSMDDKKRVSIFTNSINSLDNTNKKILDLVFGVPYEIKNPKRIGNLRVLLYIKDYPIIVIGTDCKSLFHIFNSNRLLNSEAQYLCINCLDFILFSLVIFLQKQ